MAVLLVFMVRMWVFSCMSKRNNSQGKIGTKDDASVVQYAFIYVLNVLTENFQFWEKWECVEL